MRKIICEKIARIIKSKNNLEKELNVTLDINGKEVSISGGSEDEYVAERVIEALDFGFPFAEALKIKKEDIMFEVLNVKECTSKKDLESVRGRIIGKEGKAIRTISSLGDCAIELSGNKLGIIGNCENMRPVEEACKLLIKGTKHANVYAYLEGHRPEPIIDLGLKEPKKSKVKNK